MNNDIIIERRNLIHAFNNCKNHRIIVVCAPAGYGKTMGVTGWLAKDTRVKSVISLDEYDNNIAGFCERFCAALLACQPRNQTLEEIISHPSFQSAPDEFTLRAVAALAARKQTVLVIDDLHLLNDSAVLSLLLTSIKRLPKNFQIILISRHDLSAGFSEFLLKGYAAHINAEQFLFSADEIKALYSKRGNQITQEQAKDINQQTRGWAMGINAFLLSGGESFDIAYEYLSDFIKANIWEKWDDETRDFMLRTANLRELTPSLCEAMTGVANSGKLLKKLLQKGSFISQLQDGTYRYHHLFQLFLRRMVDERGDEFLTSLLEAEGNWYLSQMDFYSAFDCFLRCKNHFGIASCFGAIVGTVRNDFSFTKIMPIVKHVEFHSAAQEYPFLFFLMAVCAFAEGQSDDMVSYMDEFYKWHPEIVAKYSSSPHNILYLLNHDFRVSLKQMLDILDELPATTNHSLSKWIVTMHMPLFHRTVRDYSELTVGDTVENCTSLSHLSGSMLGEEGSMIIANLIAGLLYEQGDLELAHKYAIKAVAEIKNHFLSESNFCSLSILACILDALGEPKEAEQVLEAISQVIEKDKAYQLNDNFNAFAMRRKLATENKEVAASWIEGKTSHTPTLLSIYIDLTTCRAFIITEKYDLALVLLRKVLGIASSFNRSLDIIESRILLAIACWKKKRTFQNEALEHLEAACRIAYPYDYVQMFINEGAALSVMLYKLQKRVEQRESEDKKHLSFIKKLYLHLPAHDVADIEIESKSEKPTKFTDKQKTVMDLLCQGKTQKVIAETMGIKQSTLRYHLASIYSKLDAVNVSDAVKKINAMRLL